MNLPKSTKNSNPREFNISKKDEKTAKGASIKITNKTPKTILSTKILQTRAKLGFGW